MRSKYNNQICMLERAIHNLQIFSQYKLNNRFGNDIDEQEYKGSRVNNML